MAEAWHQHYATHGHKARANWHCACRLAGAGASERDIADFLMLVHPGKPRAEHEATARRAREEVKK